MASTKNWSVVEWGRLDAEPPALPSRQMETPDGRLWEISEPMDNEWHARHWRPGAEIHDSRRGITYRATTDDQGELDHLEVVLTGPFDPQRLAKLTSIPIAAIQREVNLQVIADGSTRDSISVTLEGGVEGSGGDGSPYSPPSPQALVELLAAHPGWGRSEVARHYARNVRTVDRWMREARNDRLVGHLMPPATRKPPKETAEQLRERLRAGQPPSGEEKK